MRDMSEASLNKNVGENSSLLISAPLPFSDERQLALLGHLLVDNQFFLQAKDIIESSCFGDPLHMKIYDNVLGFYSKYKRQPTISELKEFEGFYKDGAVRIEIFNRIEQAISLRATYLLDVLKDELTEWLHADIFKRGVKSATALFNSMNSKEALHTIRQMIQQVQNTKFESEPEVLFTNYREIFAASEKEYENALTFGIDAVDKKLTPRAKRGSLLKGDTTVILAPTNIGKSTALMTIAMHNVREKKHVLYLAHEGRMADLYEKFWCNYLKINKNQLVELSSKKEGQEILDKLAFVIQKYLTFIPLNKAGLTIEEVVALIQRKQEQLKITEGKYYDMLVNDYPGTLGTKQIRGKNYNKRDSDAYVYDYFVQLGLEHNMHVLLAMQVNREGSKVNASLEEDGRFLRMEDAAETFVPMQRATNVFSLNRDSAAMIKDWVTFFCCKSRSGQTGWAIYCKSNYDKSITHSNELGCVMYNSPVNQSKKIDVLLRQNKEKYFNTFVDISNDLNL